MRRDSRHHPRRGAFTITELLIAIGVLAVFAAAATQLFYATMRVNRTSAERQDAAGTFDAAVAAMRADAWTAPQITSPDDGTARLGKVTWTAEDSTLTRDAGDGQPARRWELPSRVTFAGEPAAVVMRLAPALNVRGGDVRMVSQPLLLARMKP